MMPLPPLPPPPERWMFDSSEKYMRAISRYAAMKRERAEMRKTETAVMIVAAVIMVAMGAFVFSWALYISFGWRGPIGAAPAAGLLWVAVMQVRRRI